MLFAKNRCLTFLCVVLLSAAALHAQDAANLISILAPHGGERYIVGTSQTFVIVSPFHIVTVELSRDGGHTFETLGVIDNHNPSARNTFAWTVTGPASGDALLRASTIHNGATASRLSAIFNIDAGTGGGGNVPPDGSVTTAKLADGSVTTPKLADSSVTTPKLADFSVTAGKLGSGQASPNFVLGADGNGGALWESITAILPSSGTPYVSKAGDIMSGPLQINSPNLGLTVANNTSLQGTVSVGQNPPTNGQLAIGATQNGFNVAIYDNTPNLLFSDSGTGNSAGFMQFRDSDQTTIRAQVAAFSPTHTTKPSWFSLINFKPAPLVLGTNRVEQMRIDGNGNVGVGTTTPNSKLSGGGSFSLPIRTSAVTTSLDAFDYTVILNTPGTTATLPDAVGIAGRIYVIKNTSVGAVTIAASNTETIDGSTTIALSPSAAANVQSDGANWFKIN